MDTFTTEHVLDNVFFERESQDRKWGDQRNLPDGIRQEQDHQNHVAAKMLCQKHAREGICSWRDVLTEELCEAYDAANDKELRLELVQVAAVAVAWIEALDRRADKAAMPVATDFLVGEHAQTD